MADTGFPDADAQADFSRARRRARLSRAVSRLRRQPDDITQVLPYDEVVAALGETGRRELGLVDVPVESIVGSVDRTGQFDRDFRPTTSISRERWARLNAAQRRGETVPPVRLRKVGGMYFVVDGHHRVSIARNRGNPTIDAYVTEILTKVDADGIESNRDLVLKDHRRIFLSRVPLTDERAAKIVLPNPWKYAELAENVEAWGFRAMQAERTFFGRDDIADRWFTTEYEPVVAAARSIGLAPNHTDAELYVWIAAERYRLIRRHEWTDEVFEQVRETGRQPD
ncbi:ParB N-terminal domain-containing protein [Corynebacterium hansenii]|uniref:ParB N-terminal domain-containing protein n=1 Tax=Corynebacterium hansenii TaxID=394964 RepID=A0ABV7ZNQ7_9CORY|nr:ParB N-terminal domain-containing protein [Corynebacterium hansenii]WJZ00776.1 ParB-like nuclease domain protein [Corynebacterium hansenii]